MFKSSKHAFWEALILTIVIFIIGVFLGISYEGKKVDDINNYYTLSEISLMDSFVLSNINSNIANLNCENLVQSHIEFANRIYDEAYILEKYEDSGKITEGLKIAHKRYDLLRTLLWSDSSKTLQKCPGTFSLVVYLYDYQTKDLVKKAEQQVWSRILFNLKQANGDKILLIPIAVDSDLSSLNAITNNFNITDYPIVIINDKNIISQVSSIDDLEKYIS